MSPFIDIRTLLFVITLLLLCRAAIMAYVWTIARQYPPVRDWALGSMLIAGGALAIGMRGAIPLPVSIVVGQTLVITGWLVIDAGIVAAAGRKPPWRVGMLIAAASLLATYWLTLGNDHFAWRTVVVSTPCIVFDLYAALACFRAPHGRTRTTLRILGGVLAALALSNVFKTAFIAGNGLQQLFAHDWQVAQFFLVSMLAAAVSAVLFVLLAAQRLQEQLDVEIAERRHIEAGLRDALAEAERFRLALDRVPVCVYIKDTESRYLYANRPTLEFFGCTAEELPGSDDSRFFPAATVDHLRAVDRRVFSGEDTREEIDVPDAPGGRRVFLEVKTPVYDDPASRRVVGLCGVSTDITALKEHERQLQHVAHFDALTELPNRILLADRLRLGVAQANRRRQAMAVAFLDLDGFKEVNDRHGHAVGDALLVSLSRRMARTLRHGDTLARLGGDEFVAVLVDLDRAADCEPVLDRLLLAAAEPIAVAGMTVQVSASIGVAVFPDDDADPDRLLRHADQAMYRAKQAGKNCVRRYRDDEAA